MKKSISYIISTLVIVLCLSFGVNFIINGFKDDKPEKTYSMSTCLNEQVTESMSRTDIAKIYKDSCVTVTASIIFGNNYDSYGHMLTSKGSGVCVAASGYTVGSDYSASKGSYFLTNYHVISLLVEPDYTKNTISSNLTITLDRDSTEYDCTLLWSNKAVDMAIIYCDESLEIGWIEMQDRSIACSEEEKLVFDEIFTIGTPLGQFKNTLSLGYVSNTDLDMKMATYDPLYSYSVSTGMTTKRTSYTTNPYIENSNNLVRTNVVLSNFYENLFMMNCDITNGNSGGGIFDSNGKLIGLATLGVGSENAGTAALNFGIPIYPATLALNEVILKNEGNSESTVKSIDSLGIIAVDLNERDVIVDLLELDIQNENNRFDEDGIYHGYVGIDKLQYIYVNGTLFLKDAIGDALASFNEQGVMILSGPKNSKGESIYKTGFIITSIYSDDNAPVEIKDRNDLIYFLLECKSNDIKFIGHLYGDDLDTTITVAL